MAKKIKVSVTDFLEKTLGMSASAESMRMEYTSRRRNNEIYSKPMNPYRLAKDLADIQADQYRQHAESVTATAMSEAALRGYGELSVQDVTDKVTEGAKNAWKSFLVLIDKLISVIKEFIRGLFDKEKKLDEVMRKVKTALKRVSDSSRLDSSKEIKVAELSDEIFGFVKIKKENKGNKYKVGEVTSSYIEGLTILLDDIKGLRSGAGEKGDLLGMFIVVTLQQAQALGRLNKSLKLDTNVDTGTEKLKGTYTIDNIKPDDINLNEYKEDWNIVIKDFNNLAGAMIKSIKKSDNGTSDSDSNATLKITKVSRSENNANAIKKHLNLLYQVFTGLKKSKVNANLEKCIKALNELRQAIIRNKDGRFSNKYAQLGRVTISKITVVYTKTIAIMNAIYATCFKAAGINIAAVNSLMQKDTNSKKDTKDFGGRTN